MMILLVLALRVQTAAESAGSGTNPWVLAAGAIATVIASVLGYLGATKGKRASNQRALVDQVEDWASDLRETERQCREDQELLRLALQEVREELRVTREELYDTKSELREVRAELDVIKNRKTPS